MDETARLRTSQVQDITYLNLLVVEAGGIDLYAHGLGGLGIRHAALALHDLEGVILALAGVERGAGRRRVGVEGELRGGAAHGENVDTACVCII